MSILYVGTKDPSLNENCVLQKLYTLCDLLRSTFAIFFEVVNARCYVSLGMDVNVSIVLSNT